VKTAPPGGSTSAAEAMKQMRVIILDFLDTDVFNVSVENCVAFLDPLIESWDIDLTTFGMEIVLNRRLAQGTLRNLSLSKGEPDQPEEEPGLKEFLRDPSLSGDATDEEIDFLKRLRFKENGPPALLLPRIAEPQRPLHFPRAHGSDPAQKNIEAVPSRKDQSPRCINIWLRLENKLKKLKNAHQLRKSG